MSTAGADSSDDDDIRRAATVALWRQDGDFAMFRTCEIDDESPPDDGDAGADAGRNITRNADYDLFFASLPGEEAVGDESDPAAPLRPVVLVQQKRRGRKPGSGGMTREQEWALRVTDAAIYKDVQAGCGRCPKRCIETARVDPAFNIFVDCAALRSNLLHNNDAGRRDFLRNYIYLNQLPATAGGRFDVIWRLADGRPVCLNAFCVRTGFKPNFVYRTMREYSNGVIADDPLRGGAAARHDEDSVQRMQVYGWIKGLKEQCQLQPNTLQCQLEWMQRDELFDQFYDETLKSGVCAAGIASERVFFRIFDADKTIVIREYLNVNGKDRVRAFLRQALRNREPRHAGWRALIRALRAAYRDSLRREREFYWNERIRPVQQPLQYMTFIYDGATQTYTVLPKMPNYEGSVKACQLKLVGFLVHGHVLILYIVHPHVPDNANLSCVAGVHRTARRKEE